MDSEGMTVEDFFSDKTDEENHPLKALEWMDVIEIATKQIVGDLLIFPFGDGVVLKHGTERMIANIVQHGITPTKDTTKTWMTDFAKAWWEGGPALGVRDVGHFGFRPDQIEQPDDPQDHAPAAPAPASKSAKPAAKPAAKPGKKPAAKPARNAAQKAPKGKAPAKKPAAKAKKKAVSKRR
jgi:hypothetical protein